MPLQNNHEALATRKKQQALSEFPPATPDKVPAS